jgi:ParB family chromosome partitioning protein
MALIENIQREDLNPIEEAIALERLQREFEMTQQQVADAVGKSRSAVANLLRLTSLEPEVRTMLEHRDIDMGHARCLLGLPAEQQLATARQVAAKDLSVRQTENLVRRLLAEKEQADSGATAKDRSLDPDIRRLQDELAAKLGTRVSIQHGAKGNGKLVLAYSSLDELDGILAHLR